MNKEREVVTEEFKVRGMHCASCGMLIDEALEELRGVELAKTSVRKGTTTVTFDPAVANHKLIAKAIKKAGYTVAVT